MLPIKAVICAVHPHAGGENHPTSSTPIPAQRFTPTRVGKTREFPKAALD